MTTTDSNYLILQNVLEDAYDQAASGKGATRHGQGQAFEDQPMLAISNLLNTADGLRYQLIKKTQESQRMGYEAARKEMLGAIVYAAGVIIKLDIDNTGPSEEQAYTDVGDGTGYWMPELTDDTHQFPSNQELKLMYQNILDRQGRN